MNPLAWFLLVWFVVSAGLFSCVLYWDAILEFIEKHN